MSPIRSSTLEASSDLLKQNQTSNGVYPVRLHLNIFGYESALYNKTNYVIKMALGMKVEV